MFSEIKTDGCKEEARKVCPSRFLYYHLICLYISYLIIFVTNAVISLMRKVYPYVQAFGSR